MRATLVVHLRFLTTTPARTFLSLGLLNGAPRTWKGIAAKKKTETGSIVC